MWISVSITTVLLAVYQQQDFVRATQVSSEAVNLTIPHWNKEVIHNNPFVDPLGLHLTVVLAIVQHSTQQTTEDKHGNHSKDAVSKHKLKEFVKTNVKHMKIRLRRQTAIKYQPYTSDPYDLGPLNQCVRPSVGRCTFSSDITVPEYYARQMRSLEAIFDFLDNLLESANIESECRSSVITVHCDLLARIKCVGNDMVKLDSGSVTVCEAATAKLSGCSAQFQQQFQTAFCTDAILDWFQYEVTGQYSLTDCRTPAISICETSGESPQWIVVQYESVFTRQEFNVTATALQLTGDCQTDYLRTICTMPTCTSENRLQGTLSYSQCQDAAKCITDELNAQLASAALHCSDYKTITIPSSDSGNKNILPNLLFLTAIASMLHLVL